MPGHCLLKKMIQVVLVEEDDSGGACWFHQKDNWRIEIKRIKPFWSLIPTEVHKHNAQKESLFFDSNAENIDTEVYVFQAIAITW
jgi:hypothetical protein